MFLCKTPCRVARVLDERYCPPPALAHNISDYPIYYDALYYPQYYPSFFESPENFCSWVARSLVDHPPSCHSCTVVFAGCVSFDGNTIVVTHNKVSVSFPLPVFQTSNYTHCTVLRHLASVASSDVATLVVSSINRLPPCFQHDPALITKRLGCLMAPSLAVCASSLSCSSIRRAKAANIELIVCHFVDLRV